MNENFLVNIQSVPTPDLYVKTSGGIIPPVIVPLGTFSNPARANFALVNSSLNPGNAGNFSNAGAANFSLQSSSLFTPLFNSYLRPSGVDIYFRPDGTSIFIRP